jgi:hypothetical protein
MVASIVVLGLTAIAPPTRPDTGVLSGIVFTDTATPRPVRRATVRLSGAAATARLVGTDDEGKFVFEALPAGHFTLSVNKPGYVTAFHGSTRPGRGPGVLVAIAEGRRTEVTLKMVPGAAITGTVADALGRPAPTVPVAAVAVRAGDTATAPIRATTDDRGIYRIYGLAPGDYLVAALPRVSLLTSVRGMAAGTEIVAITDEEVQWAKRARSTASPVAGAGRPVAYAPVFYPGTTDAAAAARVSVRTGEERGGVDISLRMVPMSRITGSLIDDSGRPVSPASVALYPRRREQSSLADVLMSSGAITMPRATMSGAAFSILGVAPGEYTMVARSGSPQRGAPPTAGDILWNVTDIAVDGFDQTDVLLHLVPGTRISGSLRFDGATAPRPPDLTAIEVSLASSVAGLIPRAVMDPSGTFRFSSVQPGLYTIKVSLPQAVQKWTLKSAVVKERDLAAGRFDVRPGADLEGVVITLTDHPAEISGHLVDAAGGAVTRYSIVVFTVDPSQWRPESPRIRSTPPATDGSFRIAGLPPGEYAIAAVEDVEPADLSDAAFLSRLIATSHRFTLMESESKRQDLRIGR